MDNQPVSTFRGHIHLEVLKHLPLEKRLEAQQLCRNYYEKLVPMAISEIDVRPKWSELFSRVQNIVPQVLRETRRGNVYEYGAS